MTSNYAENLYKQGREHKEAKRFYDAFPCFREAADMGYIPADYEVANALMGGKGVQKDTDFAYRLYKKIGDGRIVFFSECHLLCVCERGAIREANAGLPHRRQIPPTRPRTGIPEKQGRRRGTESPPERDGIPSGGGSRSTGKEKARRRTTRFGY